MHTYTVLSQLLLQLSVPLGLLISLSLVWALLRRSASEEGEAGGPMMGRVLLWAVLGLLALALHVALGQALWLAAASGDLVSCSAAACPGPLVNLSQDSQGFWLTALTYWLMCMLAPLVYLYPLARAARAAWRRRRAPAFSVREEPVGEAFKDSASPTFADTAPLDR